MGSTRQQQADLEEELNQPEPEEEVNRGPFRVGDVVKVVALRMGHFLHKRRREGDVFRYKLSAGDLPVLTPDGRQRSTDKAHANLRMLPTWMAEAPARARLRETGSTEALKREQADIRRSKQLDAAAGVGESPSDEPDPLGRR